MGTAAVNPKAVGFEHDQSKLDYRLLGYTKAYFSSSLLSTPRSVAHISALVMGIETVKVLTYTNLPVLVWR